MRCSIFGCRCELTIGVGRYRSDLLGRRLFGGRLVGGRLFRHCLFRGGLFFGCLCRRRRFLRGFGGRLFGGHFLGGRLRLLGGRLLGSRRGWRGWRRVRGRRGRAQGWFRRGFGRVVRSILRVCHPAAPLPFLVGCTLSKVRACFGWPTVPRRRRGPPRPERKAR